MWSTGSRSGSISCSVINDNSENNGDSDGSSDTTDIGAIIGIVLGVLAGTAICCVIIFCCICHASEKKKKHRSIEINMGSSMISTTNNKNDLKTGLLSDGTQQHGPTYVQEPPMFTPQDDIPPRYSQATQPPVLFKTQP
eukprot:UN07932